MDTTQRAAIGTLVNQLRELSGVPSVALEESHGYVSGIARYQIIADNGFRRDTITPSYDSPDDLECFLGDLLGAMETFARYRGDAVPRGEHKTVPVFWFDELSADAQTRAVQDAWETYGGGGEMSSTVARLLSEGIPAPDAIPRGYAEGYQHVRECLFATNRRYTAIGQMIAE